MITHINITGSLRHTPNGETYTFSVKEFKKWKESFLKKYSEIHNVSFKSDVPNPHERETIYKKLFNMGSVDIFGTGNRSVRIEELTLGKAWEVQNILLRKY